MYVEIDFNSDEAIYIQLCNQIIIGIATEEIKEGDTLPSVRQLAELIGINMHTVNKAYAVLRQEGFVKLDRRKGAVIALDVDKLQAVKELEQDLKILLRPVVHEGIGPDRPLPIAVSPTVLHHLMADEIPEQLPVKLAF